MGDEPASRKYNRQGGRPGLDVDFKAVCDAVLAAWSGNGETMTDVAAWFGVSRGWLHKWVYPFLDGSIEPDDPEQPLPRLSRHQPN